MNLNNKTGLESFEDSTVKLLMRGTDGYGDLSCMRDLKIEKTARYVPNILRDTARKVLNIVY